MKQTRTSLIFLLLLLLLLPGTAVTLPWDKDMRNQPSIKAQESRVETTPESVPITVDEPISPPVNIGELVNARLQAGDGPVARKFIPDPMNLTLDYVQIQPDGQLFYTISHGSIAMPSYRDSITVKDRWHLINYIKAVLGEKPE